MTQPLAVYTVTVPRRRNKSRELFRAGQAGRTKGNPQRQTHDERFHSRAGLRPNRMQETRTGNGDPRVFSCGIWAETVKRQPHQRHTIPTPNGPGGEWGAYGGSTTRWAASGRDLRGRRNVTLHVTLRGETGKPPRSGAYDPS